MLASLGWDDGVRTDFLKADVEGFEQNAILGGVGAWIPEIGMQTSAVPPRHISAECNRKAALQRGQNTWFWKSLARQLGCKLHMGFDGVTWWQRLFFSDYLVLWFCGGLSVNLLCD